MDVRNTIGATTLVRMIHDEIPRGEPLRYVNPANDTQITVLAAQPPYGPVTFTRRRKGQHSRTCKAENISEDILRRVAGQITPHEAFSIDAILNGTGNNRSVLEAIIAHLSQFYTCYPGRHLNGIPERRKYLYWNPDKPHRPGSINETEDIRGIMARPEQPYALQHAGHPARNFDKLRPHQQVQVKAFEFGAAMDWGVWIAGNDQNIRIGRRRLIDHPSAIQHLSKVPILQVHPTTLKAARHLDIMFIRNDGFIPAVMEVEHTTGVSSGLARMNAFRHSMAGVYANGGAGGTSFIICADDSMAAEVMAKASTAQFRDLAPRFLPYSRVDLLWSLCRDNRHRAFKENVFEVFSDPCR
jgi:type II restriction enzyme